MMISALFNLISTCGHFVWDLLCALLNLAGSLLSAVFTVLAWPFKAFHGLLQGTLHWTPLFLGICTVLGALVLGLALLALVNQWRRKYK